MSTIFEVYKSSCEKLINKQNEEINVRILLNYVNKFSSMSEFYLSMDKEVCSMELYNELFNRYLNGEPVQYLTNEAYFLNDTYYVDNRVLIPRMETEEVALFTIHKIKEIFQNRPIEIVDVCSGSGCLGISVAKNVNCSKLYLSDISSDAINVSKINVKNNYDLEKASFIVSSGLKKLINSNANPSVIVSNPPYIIDKGKVDESTLKYEPPLALFIDKNISIYKEIITDSLKFKNKPLLLVFEISDEIYPLIKEYLDKNYSKAKIEYTKDINKKWRIVSITII